MGHNPVCECLSEGRHGELEERVHGATQGLRKVQVLNIEWITLETEGVDSACLVFSNQAHIMLH